MNVKDLKLSPAQWIALLQRYGVSEQSLRGRAAPCPVCGGRDRFTYDNKLGRGDWICRQCDGGEPMAGDGLSLICRVTGMKFAELMRELEGGTLHTARMSASSIVRHQPAPGAKSAPDKAFVEQRLTGMWQNAQRVLPNDLVMRYLQARVPGLRVTPPASLRLGMLDYWHEKRMLGLWPAIVARYELPDGRLGTLHRTYLERGKPCKAHIVSADGEILDVKRNDMTLHPLAGGAVRLMAPVNGAIGIAEGLETAYAAHMQFGMPVWYCLNSGLLKQFVVPGGLGIQTVHIYVDFDVADVKNGKSVGVVAGMELAKRLRAQGYTAWVRRPRVRGSDFADEWMAAYRLRHAVSSIEEQAATAV